MLVLSRKNQQSIKVGDDIEVFFLGMKNGWARIGIQAPVEVQIIRAELVDSPKKGLDADGNDAQE